MKNTLYHIAIIALIVFISFPLRGLSQSMILAGQTEGEYIHYTDYEPDSLVEIGDPIEHFDLDIDQDGNNDLGFYVQAEVVFQQYYQFMASVKIYNDQVELIRVLNAYAKELALGDTIDNSSLWTGDSIGSLILRGYYYIYLPPPGNGNYFGEFESGYLGFKIENQWETYFGWVSLNAYVNYLGGGTYIKAKSAAFYSQTVGLSNCPGISEELIIFPNPCKGKFTLDIPETDFKERNFKIFNAFGGQLMTGIFEGSKVDIDAGNLHPGVYFVEVYEASKPVYRGKIIVQ